MFYLTSNAEFQQICRRQHERKQLLLGPATIRFEVFSLSCKMYYIRIFYCVLVTLNRNAEFECHLFCSKSVVNLIWPKTRATKLYYSSSLLFSIIYIFIGLYLVVYFFFFPRFGWFLLSEGKSPLWIVFSCLFFSICTKYSNNIPIPSKLTIESIFTYNR